MRLEDLASEFPTSVGHSGPSNGSNRRANRETELRRLNPELNNTDLSVLTDVQIDGLISAELRRRDSHKRVKRRR